MPTSANTPDQRSDRYARYIQVGPTPATHLSRWAHPKGTTKSHPPPSIVKALTPSHLADTPSSPLPHNHAHLGRAPWVRCMSGCDLEEERGRRLGLGHRAASRPVIIGERSTVGCDDRRFELSRASVSSSRCVIVHRHADSPTATAQRRRSSARRPPPRLRTAQYLVSRLPSTVPSASHVASSTTRPLPTSHLRPQLGRAEMEVSRSLVGTTRRAGRKRIDYPVLIQLLTLDIPRDECVSDRHSEATRRPLADGHAPEQRCVNLASSADD